MILILKICQTAWSSKIWLSFSKMQKLMIHLKCFNIKQIAKANMEISHTFPRSKRLTNKLQSGNNQCSRVLRCCHFNNIRTHAKIHWRFTSTTRISCRHPINLKKAHTSKRCVNIIKITNGIFTFKHLMIKTQNCLKISKI